MKLHLWGNLFIPRELPGLTSPIDVGPFAGCTYLPSPLPLGGGFLTDNRDFSAKTDAPSRLHMRIVVDTEKGVVRDWHRCGETIGIHRETGEELCRGRENTDRVRVEDVVTDTDERSNLRLSFRLLGACANPCLTLAPSVDIQLQFVLTAIEGDWHKPLHLLATGLVDPFPAVEFYARRSRDRKAHTLVRLGVEPETSLISMLGPANRPITMERYIPAAKENRKTSILTEPSLVSEL
jgi:hypothetical protein